MHLVKDKKEVIAILVAVAGGYYGGYANNVRNSDYISGGAGGSGFIADNLVNSETISGNSNSCPESPSGNGNGYARITKLRDETKTIYEDYNIGVYKEIECTNLMTSTSNPVEIPDGPDGYKFAGYYTKKYELGTPDEELGNGVRLIDENGYKEDIFSCTYFRKNATIYARWIDTFEDKEIEYSGKIDEIDLPAGTYKLEVWGAQGGDNVNNSRYSYGGYGGYATGIFTTKKKTKIYVAVGEVGGGAKDRIDGGDILNNNGGWNGRRIRVWISWTTVVVE